MLVLISSLTGLSCIVGLIYKRESHLCREAGLRAEQPRSFVDSYRLVSLTVNRCQHRARDRVSRCSNCIVSTCSHSWPMGTLISFLIHPFSTVRQFRDQYDQEGSLGDLIYHATLFFAFGIYFVMRRHLNARSRAKHFRYDAPVVCLSLLGLFTRITLLIF